MAKESETDGGFESHSIKTAEMRGFANLSLWISVHLLFWKCCFLNSLSDLATSPISRVDEAD